MHRLDSVVYLAVSTLVCGCTSKPSGGTPSMEDSGIIGTPLDAAARDAPANDAPALETTLRIAQLSPDLPAIDVCYMAPSTQTLTGPVLFPSAPAMDAGAPPVDAATGDGPIVDGAVVDATTSGDAAIADADAALEDGESDATSSDAGPPGIAYLGVTSYLTIPTAGTFDILVVPAGQSTCNGALFETKVTLDTGKQYTLALFGHIEPDAGAPDAQADARPGAPSDAGASNTLTLASLTDNPAVVPGATRARFFHSAFGVGGLPATGPLAVSAVGTSTIAFGTVAPGHVSMPSATPPTVDSLGYHTDAPLAPPAAFRLTGADDASGLVWSSAVSDLGLSAATVHTGFIVSTALGGLGVLWCNETNYGEGMASCVVCSADACTPNP